MEHTFFDELFSDNLTIVDLGACKGEFSLAMNEKYVINKAILVEAAHRNFIHLPKQNNFILYNNAISDSNDKNITFYEDINSPYNGSVIFNYFNGEERNVTTITLDKIIKDNNLSHIDLLKIDIEGSEYKVLPSIPDETFNIITQITIEFHDFISTNFHIKTQEIVDKLVLLGYSYITSPTNYMNGSKYYDVLFYKK